MQTTTRAAAELRDLAERVLAAAGVTAANAAAVAAALIAAECDGIASHGLSRLPFYADQAASGKVDGSAIPAVTRSAAAVLRVDARDGFAYPAIGAGLAAGESVARALGTATIAIANSHHCGVLGHHVEWVAERGLIGLAFANTPSAIAPWGGKRAMFGTNPMAFASPRRDALPLVIDLSMAVVARGKIALAASRNEKIPEGWALDAEGQATTDAKAALGGTMMAVGGAKGSMLALMVELLAAVLTGSNFGYEASSFFEPAGSPPRVGQLFMVFDPAAFGGDAILDRVEALMATMLEEPEVRLPGDRRAAARRRAATEGITLPDELLRELEARAAAHAPNR